ncbi:MAG: TonB family protein [Pseudomonadota bacterium]
MTLERVIKYAVVFILVLAFHYGVIYALSLTEEPDIKVKGGAVRVDFISPSVSESGDLGSEKAEAVEEVIEPEEPAETPVEPEAVEPLPEPDPEPEPPAPEPEPIPEPEPPTPDPVPLPEPEPLPQPEPKPIQPSPQPRPIPPQPQSRPEPTAPSQIPDSASPSSPADAPTSNSNPPQEQPSAPSQPGSQSETSQGAQTSAPQSDAADQLGNAQEEDYRGEVLRHLRRASRISGNKGDSAMIAFTVLPSGELENARVSRSSGKKRFDRAALKSIERAAPVPAPPNGQRFEFTVRVNSN